MLVGYTLVERKGVYSQFLCLIPNKPSAEFPPVPVHELQVTRGSLFFIALDEAAKVLPEEGGMSLEAYTPAKLYLTPNIPERPGFAVNKVQIVEADGKMKVSYDIGKGWEPFEPEKNNY